MSRLEKDCHLLISHQILLVTGSPIHKDTLISSSKSRAEVSFDIPVLCNLHPHHCHNLEVDIS